MQCRDRVYPIAVPEARVSVDADLTHLETALNEIGYTCVPHLKFVQTGETSSSSIHPSPPGRGGMNCVRRAVGLPRFELVVDDTDIELDGLAKNYTPVPLRG